MDCILIAKANDFTAKSIHEWLVNYGVDVHRYISDVEKTMISHITLSTDNKNYEFDLGNSTFNMENIPFVYFKSGIVSLSNITNSNFNSCSLFNFKGRLAYFFTTYELAMKEICLNQFESKVKIGKNNPGRINKINVLEAAIKAGLQIPDTILTTKKEKVREFLNTHISIITKSLDINFSFAETTEGYLYHQLTSKVTLKDINSFPVTFPLTLFQKEIKKIIELRIFFINQKIFTAAIFSQNSHLTESDYRNYNHENMNRVIPFNLPQEIMNKLTKLMKDLGLESGSIDMILTPNQEYVFLEVNPNGQFMANSDYCNFYLDREIAREINYNIRMAI